MTVSGWLLVVVGAIGFAALYRWLGPLEPGEVAGTEAPQGFLTDGDSIWPILGMRVLIGRGAGADIDLVDHRVSSVHAELRSNAGAVALRDLGSRHGTRVNGRPLRGWAPLADGDTITVGSTSVTYHAAGATDAWLLLGGTLHPLRSRMLLGRGPDSDIEVCDRRASWLHAEVRHEHGRIVVRDLWSAHGTMVNGRLLTGPAPLGDGDVVTIGSIDLTLRTASGAVAASVVGSA